MKAKNKYYVEEFARQTLHYVCGQSLDTLICADKPDIQDLSGKVGIEVVQDTYENEEVMSHFLNEIRETPFHEVPPEKIERFERFGGHIKVNGDRVGMSDLGETPNTPAHLIETIEKKLETLNKGEYKPFDTYQLYVFVNSVVLFGSASYVDEIIECISTLDMPLSFETLYLDCNFEMYICNMKRKAYKRVEIPTLIRDEIRKGTQLLCHD